MFKGVIQPILVRIGIALQATTVLGILIVGIFVVNFSGLQVEWALKSWWIIAIIAVILVILHSLYALSLIRPAREVDLEVGLDEATPTEARRALEAILIFMPRVAFLTCFNWPFGGLLLSIAMWFLYPVTLRDVLAVVLGSLCAGLLVTVIHYHGVKVRFQSVIALLAERSQIRSADDPLFERHRGVLRHELQLAFATLISVVLLFGVMYGHTQTQRTVATTLLSQSEHLAGPFVKQAEDLGAASWGESQLEQFLRNIFDSEEVRPSPAGRFFFVTGEGKMLLTTADAVGFTENQMEEMRRHKESGWLFGRRSDLFTFLPAWGGYLVAHYPEGDLTRHSKSTLYTLLLLFLLLLTTMLGISYYVSQSITRPLVGLRDLLAGLARGDLSQRPRLENFNEVGELSMSAATMIDALRSTIDEIRAAHERVSKASGRVGSSAEQVGTASTEQADHLRQTISVLDGMQKAIQEVTRHVEELDKTSGTAIRHVEELNLGTGDVRQSATEVGNSVEETSSSIFQMAASISNVSENMAELKQSAAETARSMEQLASSIQQIQADSTNTSALSQKVLSDAEAGAEAITLTINGIQNIREATREAVRTIQALGAQMQQVGSVLTVIEEVAGQTQLLSLNAAIIAAQAGEHGQGFAVVADEIKKLSVRTAQGTKEIGALLQGIQQQALKGVEKVLAGEEAVEHGTDLSERAREALAQIERSAAQTTDHMERIARATTEQASGVQMVTRVVQNMSEMVDRVTRSTEEQQGGADQIAQSSESMRAMAERVDTAARRQIENTHAIGESMSRIAQMVDSVLNTTRAQLDQIGAANASAEQTGALAARNLKFTEQLRQVVVDLSNESKAFTAALARFRL